MICESNLVSQFFKDPKQHYVIYMACPYLHDGAPLSPMCGLLQCIPDHFQGKHAHSRGFRVKPQPLQTCRRRSCANGLSVAANTVRAADAQASSSGCCFQKALPMRSSWHTVGALKSRSTGVPSSRCFTTFVCFVRSTTEPCMRDIQSSYVLHVICPVHLSITLPDSHVYALDYDSFHSLPTYIGHTVMRITA